jgi:hypothetical protein
MRNLQRYTTVALWIKMTESKVGETQWVLVGLAWRFE